MGAWRGVISLLLVTCWGSSIVPAAGNIPLLFPALEEVDSLLYDEATNTLLPVQAAFPFFICSAGSDAIDVELGKKVCGGKIIYTKSSEYSLTLLYLSNTGAVLPIPDPEITVSNGAKYSIQAFGLNGIISPGNALSVVSNAASAPNLGRKLLQLVRQRPGAPVTGSGETPIASGALDTAAGGATDAFEAAAGETPNASSELDTAAEDAADAIETTVGETSNASSGLDTAAEDAADAIETAVGETSNASSGLDTAAGDAADALGEAAGDSVQGIKTAANNAKEKATRVAGDAVSQAQATAGGVIEKGSEAAIQLLKSGVGFVETATGIALDLSDFNSALALKKRSQLQGLTFVAQVKITGLPENKVTKVRVSSGGSDREVYIFHDTSNPQPKMSVPKQQKRIKTGSTEAEVKFEVYFSEMIFPSTLQNTLGCAPLGDEYGNLLSSKAFTTPKKMVDLVKSFPSLQDLADFAGDCNVPSGNLLSFDPADLFSIEGVLKGYSAEYRQPEFNLADLDKVTSVSISNALPKVIITAKFDPRDNSTFIDLGVGPGSVFDFAVLSNILKFLYSFSFSSLLSILDHAIVLTQEIIDKGKNLGTTAASLTAATIASSTAISIGTSVAASVGGSVAGSSSSAAGGTMSGAVDMLNVGQKVFLTGQLAVENMPENYKAFADQLKWTMFDIKLPWKSSESNDSYEQKEARRKLLQDLEGAAEEFVLDSDSDDPRDLVKRAFFWIAVFFGIFLVIHFLLTVILMLKRIRIPSILRFPRLELYFMYWAIPAIATASAGLFTGGTGDKILGAFLIALFPFTFLLWHVYILWKHFFSAAAVPKASLVYSEDMKGEKDVLNGGEEVVAESAEAEAGPDSSVKENLEPLPRIIGFLKACWAKFDALMEKCIYTPFLGAPFDEGVWIAPQGPRSMFFNRFGAMFEDYRHHPTVIKDATYNYNQDSRAVDRGVVHPIPKTGGLENTALGHAIQISGKTIDVFKLVFIAILITGEDDASSTVQAVVLLIVTVAYAVLLRVFRPPNSRWDLGMAMVGEIGDILTYIFAIMIINNDESDQPGYMESMGIALLCFQGISFLATFLDNFFTILEAIQAVIDSCKKSEEDPKMLDVVLKAQLQNPRYLERKYYNRWVLNSLGKGVHAGDIVKDAAPIEEKVFGFTSKSAGMWRTMSSSGESRKSLKKGEDLSTRKSTQDNLEK